jgi:hypothetical protein
MSADLVHIDPQSPHWAGAEGYLQSALDAGGGNKDWGLEDIKAMALAMQIDVWALVDHTSGLFGACVTVMEQYPKRRALDVLLLGTNPHRQNGWRECLEELKLVARIAGASSITGTGRPGWARMLGAKERRIFELEI